MTRDDIIRMAREAGFAGWLAETPFVTASFENFAALIAAAEREACAKVCEENLRDEYLRQARPIQEEVMLLAAIADCVAAIRARGA